MPQCVFHRHLPYSMLLIYQLEHALQQFWTRPASQEGTVSNGDGCPKTLQAGFPPGDCSYYKIIQISIFRVSFIYCTFTCTIPCKFHWTGTLFVIFSITVKCETNFSWHACLHCWQLYLSTQTLWPFTKTMSMFQNTQFGPWDSFQSTEFDH